MDLENMAISAVSKVISKTEYLKLAINSNDNQPTWDGFVYAYKHPGNNYSKDDMHGRIPVQVKGHKTNLPYLETISFSADISDLNNYMGEGGCIYLVVYFDDDGENERIYYKVLLPYDLHIILKDCTNKATKTIYLRPLPTSKNDVSNIFLNFVRDRKKQFASVQGNVFSLDDIAKDGQIPELSFGYTTVSLEDREPTTYMLKYGLYVYAKAGYGLEFAVDHLENIQMVTTKIQRNITIGEKKYYDNYLVSRKVGGETEVKVGKGFTFVIDNKGKSIKINLELKGTLSERIRDLSFVIDAFDAGGFYINGAKIPINNVSPQDYDNFDIPAKKEHLQALTVAKKTLDMLHVQKELDVDAMDERDYKNLNMLISSVYYYKWVPMSDTGKVVGFFHIANLKIIVCVKKDSERGLFKITDFFQPTLTVRVALEGKPEDGTDCPSFVALNHEAILKSSNLCFDAVMGQIKEAQYHDVCAERIIIFLLELLLAYDSSNSSRADLLAFAASLFGMIKEYDRYSPPEILRLNELQIIKRQRELNVMEISELRKMAENQDCNDEVATGAYLLMDNQKEAVVHFFALPRERQQVFSSYPIFRFWREDTETR